MAEPVKYTPEDKLRWEVEKLRIELEHLKRPLRYNPTLWIAIATVLVAVASTIFQAAKSSREYQLAEIGRQQALLETEKAGRLNRDYQDRNARLQGENGQLEEKKIKLQAQRALLLEQVAQAQEQLRQIQTRYSTKPVSGNLTAQANETASSLQALEESIKENASSLPAFAVVASFDSLQRAEGYSKDLLSKDRTYSVEVFRREPRRYAVTLGGYLTIAEATLRVSHARERGLAPDAYVRLAKTWGNAVLKLN